MAIVGRCRVGAKEQAMFAAKLSKAALAVRRRWSAARLAATATAVIPLATLGESSWLCMGCRQCHRAIVHFATGPTYAVRPAIVSASQDQVTAASALCASRRFEGRRLSVSRLERRCQPEMDRDPRRLLYRVKAQEKENSRSLRWWSNSAVRSMRGRCAERGYIRSKADR